jgi:predicted membrane-bound spermidine synthase
MDEIHEDDPQQMSPDQKKGLIIAGVVVLIIFVIIGGFTVFLLQPTTDTAKIRDVFIIFMALISLLTGVSLVVLMVQLARLINLLNNEIKPILDSTNTTISNLRGTTIFLSDNLVEPVIKLNEYMAGFSQLISVVGLGKKARRNTPK